jgi:hypothetical protein
MSRTLNGNLTGKAAHGADDINESIPAANIIDEMIEAIQFYAVQKRIQMTWAVAKKVTACLFCKAAFKLHKKQASVKDSFMAYVSIGDSSNPVDEAEIEEIPEPAQLPASAVNCFIAAIEYDEAAEVANSFNFDTIEEIKF